MNDIINQIFEDKIIKGVISNPINKDEFIKIVFSLKSKNNENYYALEKYTKKQVFHENVQLNSIKEKIDELKCNFKQLNMFSETIEYSIKVSKKDKIFFSKTQLKKPISNNLSHNKTKNYLINEYDDCQPLVDLGVFTKDGKIVVSMYSKFRQINRYLEIVDDCLKKYENKDITIIDFGCGKSYLTFVLYHYLKNIRKINPKIIGLDLKVDVIEKCNDTAIKYGYTNLSFEVGDIENFKYNNNVDMVITLHACNTATDFALFNAIKWNASIILSVPCCQSEVKQQMQSVRFNSLLKNGIIKDRFASLVTDTIRANCLELCDYNTQILEFIDMDHSLKNVLIKAISKKISDDKKRIVLNEILELNNEFKIENSLFKMLVNEKIIKEQY